MKVTKNYIFDKYYANKLPKTIGLLKRNIL